MVVPIERERAQDLLKTRPYLAEPSTGHPLCSFVGGAQCVGRVVGQCDSPKKENMSFFLKSCFGMFL